MKTLQLDIVSAERRLFTGEVQRLIVTGEVGELGIHPGHTQLLTRLKPGQVTITLADGKEDVFYLSGGMLEVQPSMVTVLADTAVRAEDLDEASAKAAKAHAEKLLSNKKSEMDYSKALIELAHATAQLRAITTLRRKAASRH